MPREIYWTDAEEIGIQLAEKFPVARSAHSAIHRSASLREELAGFADDPKKSNEPRLEAIQMAWYEEYKDAQK